MPFVSERRVDFPMVDLARIVYYPRFWDMAHSGMHYNHILSERRIGFPLVHSEAEFLHPLSYGDTVHCTITVPRVGNTSIEWHYEFRNQEGTLCWKAKQITVCTSMDELKSKISVPDWMREGLSKLSN